MSDLKVGDKIRILVDNANYTKFNAGDFANGWIREYQSDINSKIGALISKKCDCGTSKTYGTEAPFEFHSDYCSMRAKS